MYIVYDMDLTILNAVGGLVRLHRLPHLPIMGNCLVRFFQLSDLQPKDFKEPLTIATTKHSSLAIVMRCAEEVNVSTL